MTLELAMPLSRLRLHPSADRNRSGDDRQNGVRFTRRNTAVIVRVAGIRRRQRPHSGGVQEQTALSCRDRSHTAVHAVRDRYRAARRSPAGTDYRDRVKDGEHFALRRRIG